MLFAGGLGGAEGPAPDARDGLAHLRDGFADVPPLCGGIAPRTTGRANEYPQNYLSLAWEYLLQNQCQDNIGGCSVDEVHRQMVYRYEFAEDIANLLKDRSLSRIGDLINTSSFEENGFGLAVFNPLNWERSELVEAAIDFPIHDEKELQQTPHAFNFLIRAMDGSIVPYQVLSQTIRNKPFLKPLVKPLYRPVKEVKVAFFADNVPPFGYKLYRVEKTTGTPVKFQGSISSSINCMENDHLIVKIEDNGSLTIKDKSSVEVIACGRTRFEGCHIFSDGGDCGDEYNYCPPTRDAIIKSSSLKADVYLLYDGPVFCRYKIVLRLPVPAELTPDRTARSGEMKELLIQSYVQLAKNSKRVDILTEVENLAKDHRLQVLFPASKAEFSLAGSPFYIVKRQVHRNSEFGIRSSELTSPQILPSVGIGLIQGRQEEQRPEQPQLGFVHVGGLTIASNGLTEYALENNTLALTLLRCVGWLNRNDIKTRWRQIGPTVPTPDAQCLGKHSFSYSIIPQKKDVREKEINRATQEHNIPLTVVQIGRQAGPLPPELSFISIEPNSLVLSAFKKAQREDALILRFYNVTDEKVFGKVRFFKNIKAAALCNLYEEEISNLNLSSPNELNLEVNAHQIITIKMQFE
jgi:mannosylglycerate hydrolase